MTSNKLTLLVALLEGRMIGFEPLGERKTLDEGLTPFGALSLPYLTNETYGRPIIEREQITTSQVPLESGWCIGRSWQATKGDVVCYGHSELHAAMLCYVTSRLGNKPDVNFEFDKWRFPKRERIGYELQIEDLKAANGELLEALKAMLEVWEEDPAYGAMRADKARAAIKKAEAA
jgi:hypothetical protein